jgi:hypothetical protein
MRQLLLICHVLVALACVAWANGNVRILQVGLNGHCSAYRPCSVLAALSNPYSKSLDVELQVGIRRSRPEQFDPSQTYIHRLTLGPKESREIDAPIQLFPGACTVDVTVRTPEGNIIGHDSQAEDGIVTRGNYLVGVLCREESLCKGIQAQIQLSGSSQGRDEKNRSLELAMQFRPRSQWWSYAAASTVVVAVPMAGISDDERSALEWFARGGGNLVLLEEELADATFLAEYRQGPPAQEGVAIGAGRLYRISHVEALGGLFSSEKLWLLARDGLVAWAGRVPTGLLTRYATTFAFPGWWALLAWLATYVVLVGVVNFVTLHRFHRREWGWLTMAGIAFLFVFALYWLASRRGPQQVTIDYVALHHLDSRSNRAFTAYGLRVSVPQKQQVILRSPSNTLLITEWPNAWERRGPLTTVQLGRQFTRGWNRDASGGWDPLPNAETMIPMQRRTSRNLEFAGTTFFPGTVHDTTPGQLRNETGQRFADAVLVDTGQNRIWLLGEVAPGAEIDFLKARYQPLDLCDSVKSALRARGFESKGDDYFLSEFVCWKVDSHASGSMHQRTFYGLTTGAAESARPLGVRYRKREHAVLEVVLE